MLFFCHLTLPFSTQSAMVSKNQSGDRISLRGPTTLGNVDMGHLILTTFKDHLLTEENQVFYSKDHLSAYVF
jgi:hypothetical protein